MPVIKRYSNRKLYDTESKRYVTLEDIAESIRKGEEIKVVDHSTGEDLTSVTLFQVIFEEQKRIGGLLPQFFLNRLIRAGGDRVNALRSRLAALDPFQVVDEEIRHRVELLVKRQSISAEEGQRIVDLLTPRNGQVEAARIPLKEEDETGSSPIGGVQEIEEKPEPVNEDLELAEVETLTHQVKELERELELLKQARQPGKSEPEEPPQP